ncbi:MAG: cytidine deaminase [Anaerolineae bacterium]|nr:cytidine deaminase [Anaerolineae bacterium]
MDYQALIAKAIEAREKAHVPYSHFAVGAALLARSGRIYTGCNVENASYGLSICAERVAVFKAVSEGERDFEAIAVVTGKGVTPCGACRQVLLEFGEDIQVIVADDAGRYRVFDLQELLPEAFNSEDLG